MPATVTLSTTSLVNPVDGGSPQIVVASTTGLFPGVRLYVDQELMAVVSLGSLSNGNGQVTVRRGVDGTLGAPHASLSTVTIGTADQFYSTDPVGRPPDEIPVSPYINARDGRVWFAQGNTLPAGIGVRWWQQQTATYDTGVLGVPTTTLNPTSST